MKIEASVPEMISLFKEIQTQPEQLFNLIRHDIRESVGKYLSEMMEVELTQFLGRERYERTEKPSNHRNGSYDRRFTLKGIGQVGVKIPRDRQGQFQTQVIPRSQQYEDQLRQDLSVMFLTGVSNKALRVTNRMGEDNRVCDGWAGKRHSYGYKHRAEMSSKIEDGRSVYYKQDFWVQERIFIPADWPQTMPCPFATILKVIPVFPGQKGTDMKLRLTREFPAGAYPARKVGGRHDPLQALHWQRRHSAGVDERQAGG